MKVVAPPTIASLAAACFLSPGGGGGIVGLVQAFAPPARGRGIALPTPATTNGQVNGRCASLRATPGSDGDALLESAEKGAVEDGEEEEEEMEGSLLDGLKNQIAKITEKLDAAKRRRDEAADAAASLKEEKEGVMAETDAAVEKIRSTLAEEVINLSDKVEGAQDTLRETIAKTRSDISAIQQEAKEREGQLKNEITDLEDRLAALRKEATEATKERNAFDIELKREVQVVKDASRKDMDRAKKEFHAEKRQLTKQNYEYENRIQQANIDAIPAAKELDDEKKLWKVPQIAGLKDALDDMKAKMNPQVDELKEKRAAKEMFFDRSWKALKREMRDDVQAAKMVSEGEMADEDAKMETAAEEYNTQLSVLEAELQRATAELDNDPEQSAGYAEDMAQAERKLQELRDSIPDAAARQEEARAEVMKGAVDAHAAVRDQYDAELENAQWNLRQQEERSQRRLQTEDEWREGRRAQLEQEKEELGSKLSQLLQDEGAANDRDYTELTMAKETELNTSRMRSKKAMSEIQTTRSNLVFVKDELRRLESTAEENRTTLVELEAERGSFRRQLRRTMAAAVGKIARR